MSPGLVCPHCHAENLPERRYCRACGTALRRRCAVCGHETPVGEPRCAGCGSEPADDTWQPAAAGVSDELLLRDENRVVTLVKADLSGFTAMSELLGDPEEVTRIVNRVFEPLVEAVRRYGGHVDNYAGDMVIACFGVPQAVELAAERAVRAALAMRDEVARLNALDFSHGVALGISTGVATGTGLWSLVGFGPNRKRTVTGELGDYAAALEKLADRGQVAICPETHQQVFGAVGCELQGETITPPGEIEPRPVYLALEPLPPLTWAERHGDQAPPLCGQAELLHELRAAWRRAAAGESVAVWLHGPAGGGKSRLLVELARTVQADGGQVAASARDGLELDDGDVLDGLRDGEPAVVILDGVTSADASLARPGRLLACGSRRPPPDGFVGLAVTPLDRSAVAALAAHLLGDEPERDLLAWLDAWSGGNPLAVTELCAAVPDDLSAPDPLPWRLRELEDAAVDARPPAERAVLLAAAALADPADLGVSASRLGERLGRHTVEASLAALVADGLLSEAAGYRFARRLLWWSCRQRLSAAVVARLVEPQSEGDDDPVRLREGI